jgi:hypothetical protein
MDIFRLVLVMVIQFGWWICRWVAKSGRCKNQPQELQFVGKSDLVKMALYRLRQHLKPLLLELDWLIPKAEIGK